MLGRASSRMRGISSFWWSRRDLGLDLQLFPHQGHVSAARAMACLSKEVQIILDAMEAGSTQFMLHTGSVGLGLKASGLLGC